MQAVPAPLTLPRLVMRGGVALALVVLALALALGLWRMHDDIDDEVAATATLAQLLGELGTLSGRDDAAALAALEGLQRLPPLRHLQLTVRDSAGAVLLEAGSAAPPAGPLAALLALHRMLSPGSERRAAEWPLARPQGAPWTVSLAPSPESERREAMQSLLGVLGLLLACVAGLLLALRWNLRRAFAPLGRLLDAIRGIESGDTRAVRALAPMPIGELESVAAALRHLAGALDEADARRRLLSRQVLTLQEDERARIAQELHDEFGQRLTAMRADAAWLQRRTEGDAALQPVIAGMAEQCGRIQQDIRLLLARLQPFGPDDRAPSEPAERLAAALAQLVAVWRQGGTECTLALRWQPDDAAPPAPWPDAPVALPRTLALALYRISQEALTNVARHAQARSATLALRVVGAWQPGAPLRIEWSVQDDGIGIADPALAARRGNGLAGMRERVWAQGGDLRLLPASPGLRVEATLGGQWAV